MLLQVTRVRWLALLVVSACASPAPRPAAAAPPSSNPTADAAAAVLQLPLIGRLDGPTPVLVRGNVPRARAALLVAEARGVYADVSRRFLASSRRRSPPVHVCVFEDDAAYRAFVLAVFGEGEHSSLGFYRPDVRVAVVNLSRGIGNLRHELVHPLLGDDFPAIPAWLNEGIGALYGTARVKRDRVTFLVNYRVRDLHGAIRQGTLPRFADLTGASSAEVHGEHAALYYAMARYLLLFLEERGRLDTFYRDARAGEHDQAAMLQLIESRVDYEAFLTWARKLRRER